MPKSDKPTLKQRRFVAEYLKHGNGAEAVRKAYPNVKKTGSGPRTIAAQNLAKLSIQELIAQQADIAMLDQIAIREELKSSGKDYAVRSSVNRDILDRSIGKPQQSLDLTTKGGPIGISLDV